jgi:glycerophosphoryl diester phosphodiesterase
MDRYHGMDWSDLLKLMQEHPDIYYVLDTKYAEESDVTKDYRLLVEEAEQVDPALLDRIIPQLYNENMLEYVDSIHPFSSYIYTLYASKDTNRQVVDFVRSNPRIKAVTMQQYRVTKTFIESLNKIGVRTYVHTINDYGTYIKLKQNGVHGIYTDFLGYAQVLKNNKGAWTAQPALPAE